MPASIIPLLFCFVELPDVRTIRTVVLNVMIQSFPCDSRLYFNIEVVWVIVEDLIHLGQVDADAAKQGGYASFQTGAGAVGYDGDRLRITHLANLKW